MAGYSKTPLTKKLGLKPDSSVLVVSSPKDYNSFFDEFPKNISINEPSDESYDFIHLFATSMAQFIVDVNAVKEKLSKKGMLWVSWPKQNSGISSDLSRDLIREFILENGLVDIKVAAIDETWSGLKFVYRLQDR